jgi:hypothetical protein
VEAFRFKSDLRNHQAIIQPRLYDCLMVTQITLIRHGVTVTDSRWGVECPIFVFAEGLLGSNFKDPVNPKVPQTALARTGFFFSFVRVQTRKATLKVRAQP